MDVYLNYSSRRVTIHRHSGCLQIGKQEKESQRIMAITPASFSWVVAEIANQRFESRAPNTDMLLTILFDDEAFELAVLDYVLSLLGKRYSVFRHAQVVEHCRTLKELESSTPPTHSGLPGTLLPRSRG